MADHMAVVIASSQAAPTGEVIALQKSFAACHATATLLDLRAITIAAEGTDLPPLVMYGRRPIKPPSVVLLRSPLHARSVSTVLRAAWAPQGTWFVDAPSRFTLGDSSTMPPILELRSQGDGHSGTSRHSRFERSERCREAGPWLERISQHLRIGRHRPRFFGQVEAEYRVLVLLGEPLVVARKQGKRVVAASPEPSGVFVGVDAEEGQVVGCFAANGCPDDSFLGVDVTRDRAGRLTIAHVDYSPDFDSLSRALRRRIADDVAAGILKAWKRRASELIGDDR